MHAFWSENDPKYVPEICEHRIKRIDNSGDVTAYIDNVMVATETLDHHLIVLKRLFEILVENKLELRSDKCKFLFTRIEFLSYKISEKGIRPTGSAIEAVVNFPVPRNVREVQSFVIRAFSRI